MFYFPFDVKESTTKTVGTQLEKKKEDIYTVYFKTVFNYMLLRYAFFICHITQSYTELHHGSFTEENAWEELYT